MIRFLSEVVKQTESLCNYINIIFPYYIKLSAYQITNKVRKVYKVGTASS